MDLRKKIAVGAVLVLVFAGLVSALGWQLLQRRIALNAHAPRLVRLHQPPEDFLFRTLDGEIEYLSAKKGKVVFVDLWGTWCIQCVAEMPEVQKLYDHYRNDPDVAFLIVSRDDSPGTVRRFARLHHYDLPFFTMQDEDIPRSMQLAQFPTTFLYARDGSVAAINTGAANWSAPAVIDLIDKLKRE